jgi:hypothetical protein
LRGCVALELLSSTLSKQFGLKTAKLFCKSCTLTTNYAVMVRCFLLFMTLGVVVVSGLRLQPPRTPEHIKLALDNVIRSARRFVAFGGIFGTSLLPQRPPAAQPVSSATTFITAASSPLLPPMVSKETRKSPTPVPGSRQRKPFEVPARRGASSNFVREAVKVVGPSVVRVDCEREISPFMSMFAPDAYRDGDTIKVSGSGIVVTANGYLMTNSHVVQGAKSLTVTLSNGRTFKAAVVAFDELTDLAVLKADVGFVSLPVAPMGDSSSLASGDWVIAVGCPVGLDFTVTLGIVSSPKRSAFEVGAVNLKVTNRMIKFASIQHYSV